MEGKWLVSPISKHPELGIPPGAECSRRCHRPATHVVNDGRNTLVCTLQVCIFPVLEIAEKRKEIMET